MPEKPQHQSTRDPDTVATTLDIIDRDTKQLFLDGGLKLNETKAILDRIKRAREAYHRGDLNAYSVHNELVNDLTKHKYRTF